MLDFFLNQTIFSLIQTNKTKTPQNVIYDIDGSAFINDVNQLSYTSTYIYSDQTLDVSGYYYTIYASSYQKITFTASRLAVVVLSTGDNTEITVSGPIVLYVNIRNTKVTAKVNSAQKIIPFVWISGTSSTVTYSYPSGSPNFESLACYLGGYQSEATVYGGSFTKPSSFVMYKLVGYDVQIKVTPDINHNNIKYETTFLSTVLSILGVVAIIFGIVVVIGGIAGGAYYYFVMMKEENAAPNGDLENQTNNNQLPPNQYPPNQHPPNQSQPNQSQPNQSQPNQYPPNQFPPNQSPPNQSPPIQFNHQGNIKSPNPENLDMKP